MNETTQYLQVAIDAARKAGSYVREQQERPLTLIAKGYRDWATNADLTAQKMIIETIRQAFPHHHFLAEEGDESAPTAEIGDQPIWIIDPLDGTSNYARHLTNFAVSIALVINGQVQIGVVFDPVHDELFTAVSGQGSWCNGKRMQRNGRVEQLSNAMLSLDWGRSQEQRQQTMTLLENLVHEVRTIRSIGSAVLALCWVANGRLDAFFSFNMKVWDIAAAGLILCEAGCRVTAMDGTVWDIQEQSTWRLCGAPGIHEELLAHLG